MKITSPSCYHGIADFLPAYEGSKVTMSQLNRISAYVGVTGVYGIKYVVKGSEHYIVNKQQYSVEEGQYLLVNMGQELSVEYSHRHTVQGLCASLDEKLLRDTYHDLATTEECLLENPFDAPPALPGLHETVYSAKDSIGEYLQALLSLPQIDEDSCPGIYRNLACRLVASQALTRKQIHQIKACRTSTKKELFNRLNKARNIIDNDLASRTSVAALAKEVALSEFHFFRSFKNAFGQSPHQYILSRRLMLAKNMLLSGSFSVTEVAYHSGFNDIFSFSKSFKKQFSITPSQLKRGA